MTTTEIGDARLADNFWNKVRSDPNTGCWEWTGARLPAGYGRLGVRGKPKLAHRVSYAALVGPIPDGLQIDHLCRNTRCVNPAHLEAVTRSVNLRRGRGPAVASAMRAAVTHCPKGHAYAGDNLYIYLTKSGYVNRQCRACRHDKVRERRARLKDEALH